MAKSNYKIGKFSGAAKTSLQSNLRLNKLSKIQNKEIEQLTKKENALLKSKTAFKAQKNAYNKIGRVNNKNYNIKQRAYQSLSNSNNINSFDNLGVAINTSNEISVKDMINKKSSTGVLSQRDVSSALGGFISKLKNTSGIIDVNVLKNNNKITGVDIKKDFQKTKFNFNPNKLTFSTKGWDLDIPDNYIKKSDIHYVAPSKKYTDYAKYRNDRSTNKNYNTYNPVEVFLNGGGNKLSKVIKKQVYEKSYKNTEDGDKYRNIKDYDVFVSGIKDYSDTGIVNRERVWSDYATSYKHEDRGRDNEEEEEKREVYLKSDISYNPTGYKKSSKQWDNYIAREKENKRGRYEQDLEEQGKIFLKSNEEYNDVGQLLRQQRYDDYIAQREQEFSNIENEEDTKRNTYLENDTFFDNGKKIVSYSYNDYLSAVDSGSRQDAIRQNERGVYVPIGSVRTVNKNINAYKDKYGNSMYSYDSNGNIVLNTIKTRKSDEDYDVGLRSITFYDPVSENITNTERFW